MDRHVLVVYPHPDDETMASGGEIALHTKAGTPVTYACFTLGEMGRNMGNPIIANRETLPLTREAELRNACDILGIGDLRLLGFRDKTLEFEDPELLTNIIYNLLIELEPTLVITYYPGHSVHPDHEAIAHAAVRAVARLPEHSRPVLHCTAFSKNHLEVLGEPDVVLDTSSVWKIKFEALKAHQSQTAAWLTKAEAEMNADAKARERMKGDLSRETCYTYRV